MRVLSLFSGGGLGDYGLELAGMEIVGQVEIDAYCQKILKLRWPEVPKWRDIKKFSFNQNDMCAYNNGNKDYEKYLGRIDLISGGFPCQDISVAGRGVGIKGERSGLWKEMFRIICEIRPRYVLVENVTALLSRGLGVVLGDLAESGYCVEWDCIPASAVGAPHQRDRVWLVAYTDDSRCNDGSNSKRENKNNIHEERKPEEDQQSGSGRKRRTGEICESAMANPISNPTRSPQRQGTSRDANKESQDGGIIRNDFGNGSKIVADSSSSKSWKQTKRKRREDSIRRSNDCRRIEDKRTKISIPQSKRRERGERGERGEQAQPRERIFRRVDPGDKSDFWAVEPAIRRVVNGCPKRVERLKLLGNGQVVQVCQFIGERIMEFDSEIMEDK